MQVDSAQYLFILIEHMAEYLFFNSRDDLVRVAVSSIVYLEAEGNYTDIVLANGYSCLVSLNLCRMEEVLSASLKGGKCRFARIGKRHIINMNHILQITPMKQTLVLSDQKSFLFSLNISKEALKRLKDLVVKSNKTTKE